VTGSQFSGLTTFANLPYVNCLVEEDAESSYDIAFLGAPFDTVGSSFWPFRQCAAFGHLRSCNSTERSTYLLQLDSQFRV
jgi:hypothetical protein